MVWLLRDRKPKPSGRLRILRRVANVGYYDGCDNFVVIEPFEIHRNGKKRWRDNCKVEVEGGNAPEKLVGRGDGLFHMECHTRWMLALFVSGPALGFRKRIFVWAFFGVLSCHHAAPSYWSGIDAAGKLLVDLHLRAALKYLSLFNILSPLCKLLLLWNAIKRIWSRENRMFVFWEISLYARPCAGVEQSPVPTNGKRVCDATP